MYLNRFSVQVEKGRETDNGYVELRHNTEYALRLRNDRNVAADAVVRIDGLEIGTWRIPAHQSILIERPANVDRKFTFYKLGSVEGNQAGLERNSDLPCTKGGDLEDIGASYDTSSKGVGNTRSYSAGGTGLGDRSNQRFGQAQAIDRDYANQVTINLRLVAVDEPAIVSLRSAVSSPVPPSVY